MSEEKKPPEEKKLLDEGAADNGRSATPRYGRSLVSRIANGGIMFVEGVGIPFESAEIHVALNPPSKDEPKDDDLKDPASGLDPMMRAARQFGASAVLLGQVIVRDLSPLLAASSASLEPFMQRWRAWQVDQYYSGTVWADTNGRWQMAGYDEDLTWFRDLLAFRYGDAVGPVVHAPHPHFQIIPLRFLAYRAPLRPDAEDPWAETDEACIRRWARVIEVVPKDFPPKDFPPKEMPSLPL